MKVRFIKDPCGLYNLCYEVGEEINLPDAQGLEVIETGHAEPVEIHIEEVETAVSMVKKEKAVRR